MELDIDDTSDTLVQENQRRHSERRTTMDNPYLLPTYGSFSDNEQLEKKEGKSPVKKEKAQPTFKKLATAITQQRKLNSLLQVTTEFYHFGQHEWYW